jgi:hypothetical protein
MISSSPAVDSRTPRGSRSKIGTPSSSSSASTRRFSAVEVMASVSAAFRIDPARAIASI